MPDPQIPQRLETLDQSQVRRDIRGGPALAQKKDEAMRDFPVTSFEDPAVPQQANGHTLAARGLKHAVKSKNVHQSLIGNSDARSRRCWRKKKRELQYT